MKSTQNSVETNTDQILKEKVFLQTISLKITVPLKFILLFNK